MKPLSSSRRDLHGVADLLESSDQAIGGLLSIGAVEMAPLSPTLSREGRGGAATANVFLAQALSFASPLPSRERDREGERRRHNGIRHLPDSSGIEPAGQCQQARGGGAKWPTSVPDAAIELHTRFIRHGSREARG